MTTDACSRDKPEAKVADWTKDWTTALDGDTISTSSWAVAGPDALLVVDSDTNSSSSATVWLSGGTEGVTYRVTNTINTAGLRTHTTVLLMEIINQ